jgi:hypothetical protein
MRYSGTGAGGACASGPSPGLPAGITKRVDTSCRLGPQTAPDAYTFADDVPRPVPTASSTSPTQWSRPIRIDVCSMFARMPRYGPAQPGIRSATRMRATGQNGSSRHMLVLFSSSSRRINEYSSGLLIRRFGVQVPGGAPVMTWGFISPGLLVRPVCLDLILGPAGLRLLRDGSRVRGATVRARGDRAREPQNQDPGRHRPPDGAGLRAVLQRTPATSGRR